MHDQHILETAAEHYRVYVFQFIKIGEFLLDALSQIHQLWLSTEEREDKYTAFINVHVNTPLITYTTNVIILL